MEYYKVVKKLNNKRVSVTAEGDARIEYSTDKYSETPDFLKTVGRGPLIFDDYKLAEIFFESEVRWNDLELWECKVVNPRLPKEYCSLLDLRCGEIITTWYIFPAGTMECDSVLLTRHLVSGIKKV